MPTSKYRLNVSLSPGVKKTLTQVAKRDRVPTATKAARLLELALELEEDEVLGKLAAERDASGGPYLSHEETWK